MEYSPIICAILHNQLCQYCAVALTRGDNNLPGSVVLYAHGYINRIKYDLRPKLYICNSAVKYSRVNV